VTRGRWLAVAVVAAAAVLLRGPLVAWFTGAPVRGAATEAEAVVAGPWRVAVTLDPDPPRADHQAVRVRLADLAGAPVDGADVDVSWDMPAMGAMAEMKASAKATAEPAGVYTVRFDLPMAGTWGLAVRLAARGACAIARWKLTLGQPGLTPDGTTGCAALAAGAIHIDPARQRELGITTAPATRAPMTLDLRAVGRVTYDEGRLTDVVLKVSGYVSGLRVRAVGQPVTRGDVLLSLYSPDLYAAQQDYLVARASGDLMGTPSRGEGLVRAAEQKLALLGMPPGQLHALAERGQPIEQLPVLAPASGSVIEKTVVDGDAVQAGQRLFRIAALDRVWLEADLFAADLPHVAVGMPVGVVIGGASTPPLTGKVAFVYPYLDPQTRSGRARIELANPGLALKPDMYATVTFAVPLGDRLSVPSAAIVYTGPRRVVYVELGDGAIAPRDVQLGAHAGDRTEIVSGLADGDVVVTSGNFLVAAESRLRAPEARP
jgi:multidrug efflux pump subunit AcrA (membrane-fusion protein)